MKVVVFMSIVRFADLYLENEKIGDGIQPGFEKLLLAPNLTWSSGNKYCVLLNLQVSIFARIE